jgi:hypothetical protein
MQVRMILLLNKCFLHSIFWIRDAYIASCILRFSSVPQLFTEKRLVSFIERKVLVVW